MSDTFDIEGNSWTGNCGPCPCQQAPGRNGGYLLGWHFLISGAGVGPCAGGDCSGSAPVGFLSALSAMQATFLAGPVWSSITPGTWSGAETKYSTCTASATVTSGTDSLEVVQWQYGSNYSFFASAFRLYGPYLCNGCFALSTFSGQAGAQCVQIPPLLTSSSFVEIWPYQQAGSGCGPPTTSFEDEIQCSPCSAASNEDCPECPCTITASPTETAQGEYYFSFNDP